MIQRAQEAPGRRRSPAPRPGVGLALLGAAAGFRMLVAWLGHSTRPPDPRLLSIAGHLAAGHGFAAGPAGAPAPTASLAPVAPAALSVALRVTHSHPFALPALAIFAGAVATLAAARLVTGLHGPTAGRAAGWAVALSPLLAAGATLPGPALFGLLMLLALTAGAEWLRTPRRARAVGVGALCGLAALTAPVGTITAPLLLAWGWRPLGLTLPARERLNQSALLILGFVGVVVPWAVRNSIELGAPVGVTTSTGVALRSGNNPSIWDTPALRGGTIDVLRVEPYASQLARATEPEADQRAFGDALSFIASRSPTDVARVALARLTRLASPRLESDGAATPAPPRADPSGPVLMVAETVWMLLAVWGALISVSGPRRWFQSLPLVTLLALVSNITPVPPETMCISRFELQFAVARTVPPPKLMS